MRNAWVLIVLALAACAAPAAAPPLDQGRDAGTAGITLHGVMGAGFSVRP